MSEVNVSNVSKTFSIKHSHKRLFRKQSLLSSPTSQEIESPGIHDVSFKVDNHSITAILGPSGCGKTTLLRLIAGFEKPDSGTIKVGEHIVATADEKIWLPPEKRHITIVPQEGALFPHLNVYKNIEYGIPRAAKTQERFQRIQDLLTLTGLNNLKDRMPHELSGGQQQRVALARALAPAPSVVLLDEPFSALDASLRAELRNDVREVLHHIGATAIIVTHDQDEALSLADQVVVMDSGYILQTGTPNEIYRHPINAQVAQFVGDAIIVPAVLTPANSAESIDTAQMVDTVFGQLPLSFSTVPDKSSSANTSEAPFSVVIRPEQFELLAESHIESALQQSHVCSGIVRSIQYFGHDLLIKVSVNSPWSDNSNPLEVQIRMSAVSQIPTIGSLAILKVHGAVAAVLG